MSWYDSSWSNRHPVISDRGATEAEWSLVVPKNWDAFWDNVSDTSTGFDIIVCEQDGETLTTFDLSGFNHATKTCTIRWNGAVAEGSGAHGVYWIYWGHSSTAPDLTGTPTVVSLTSALISLIDPSATQHKFDHSPERPGSTAPADEMHVTSSDDVMVWIRIPRTALPPRLSPSKGSDQLYEADKFAFSVEQGAIDQSLDTPAKNRVAEDKNGDFWVGCFFDGATTGNNYTGKLQLDLSSPTEPTLQIYKRFLIKCNNVSEA